MLLKLVFKCAALPAWFRHPILTGEEMQGIFRFPLCDKEAGTQGGDT